MSIVITSSAAAATAGFVLSLTQIVAIGAQNAYVLRQGLRREHVGALVVFCAAADIALIGAGVAGFGALLQALPRLEQWLTLAGAAFLAGYGLRALLRARAGSAALVQAARGTPAPRTAVLAQAAAFTLLNPHVYLDTVLLIGAVGAQQPEGLRGAFTAGAGAASALWFGALGYGARHLAAWFARPRSWQLLDALVGVLMLGLAAQLFTRALQ